jgi:hypothetical protein
MFEIKTTKVGTQKKFLTILGKKNDFIVWKFCSRGRQLFVLSTPEGYKKATITVLPFDLNPNIKYL